MEKKNASNTLLILCAICCILSANAIEIVVVPVGPSSSSNYRSPSYSPSPSHYSSPNPSYSPNPSHHYSPSPSHYSPSPSHYSPYPSHDPTIIVCVARPPTLLNAQPLKDAAKVFYRLPSDICSPPHQIKFFVKPKSNCSGGYCRTSGESERVYQSGINSVREAVIGPLTPGIEYTVRAQLVYSGLGASELSNAIHAEALPHYKPPVHPPYKPPYKPPVHPPYKPPVHPPYKPPVHPPYKPPVHPPYKPPVHPPYKPPVHPPYKPPVHPPYKPPVHPPYKPPVHPPYKPPVHPPYKPPQHYPPGSPKHVQAEPCGKYSVLVSWTPPHYYGNALPLEYEVRVSIASDDSHPLLRIGQSSYRTSKVHVTVKNLTPLVRYKFVVIAKDQKGLVSAPSQPAFSRTALPGFSKPSPPQDLKVFPIDKYKAKLKFSPPKCDAGCPIKKYIVHVETTGKPSYPGGPLLREQGNSYELEFGEGEYSLVDDDFVSQELLRHPGYKPPPQHIEIVLSGLIPGEHYRITVRAKSICTVHPKLVYKVSEKSNAVLIKTCDYYKSRDCKPHHCECRYGDICDSCSQNGPLLTPLP